MLKQKLISVSKRLTRDILKTLVLKVTQQWVFIAGKIRSVRAGEPSTTISLWERRKP